MRIHIRDLDALAEAAELCGCELVRGQQTHKWFGTSVGDTPLPTGFKVEDLGKCDHAIRVKGNKHAYEVGVVKRRDGKPGYQLLIDVWAGGQGLMAKIGTNAEKLNQEYSLAVSSRVYRKQGYRVEREQKEEGNVELRCYS